MRRKTPFNQSFMPEGPRVPVWLLDKAKWDVHLISSVLDRAGMSLLPWRAK